MSLRAIRSNVKDSDSSKGSFEVQNNMELARRSSILSAYNDLSIQSDVFSVVDSTASVFAPSINEPCLDGNASPEEHAMHDFLNNAGIFQVNVKDQLR